jgi:hypothetical protein
MPAHKTDMITQDRHSSSKTWSFTFIDGENAYDQATNTIRIKHSDGRVMYTYLASMGVFVEPDPAVHMIVHLHNWDVKPVNDSTVVPGIGILMQIAQFEEWKISSTSGISAHSNTTSGTALEGEEWVLKGRGGPFPTGISVRKDGSLVLRGQGTEIVLADEIYINGITHREHEETRNNLLRSNPMRQFVLPSFCVFPLPTEIPTSRLFWSLGSIVKTGASLSRTVSSLV